MLRIHFKDEGQDILWWDVDENNIVKDCNMQRGVWMGTEIIMDDHANYMPDVKRGKLICKFPVTGRVDIFKHPIEKIEKHKVNPE